MKKLLVVCGPTAVGKTSLALFLAKVFQGELVSADSRQVYKEMDIGTGKDLPLNARFKISDSRFKNGKIGYYEVGTTKIWGYDLVDSSKEFSVVHYVGVAVKIINNIWERGKLPILVGGTGFYIKGLVDGIDTMQVPRNEVLRETLENKSAAELYKILKDIDSKKAEYMNISDTQNPRRLVRAIEVAEYNKNKSIKTVSMIRIISTDKADTLFIGLMAPKDFLNEQIEKRVKDRLKAGLEKEIECLLKAGISWDSQAMQSLGYRQWRNYFESFYDSGYGKGNTGDTEVSKDAERKKVIEEWKKAEVQYAKRQMTWFKKDKRIKWFDISKTDWRKDVEKTVREWHNSKYNAEKD